MTQRTVTLLFYCSGAGGKADMANWASFFAMSGPRIYINDPLALLHNC